MNEYVQVLARDLARAEVDLKRTITYGPYDIDYQLARDAFELAKTRLAEAARNSLRTIHNTKAAQTGSAHLQPRADTDLIGGTDRLVMDASICGLSPYEYDLILIETEKPMFALVRHLRTGVIEKVFY